MKTMKDIGERTAIDHLTKILNTQDLIVNIGDDCGVFQHHDHYILISTDMITEKTHIPKAMKPWDIGWFIVAINLSDIACKGGKPEGIVLSCGLPGTYHLSDYTTLMKGATACTKQFHTLLLGGDTKENQHLTIAGTAIGTVSPDHYMSRFGAKEHDVIAVTGSLGKAAAGYHALSKEKQEVEMLKGLLHPIPQIKAGSILASTKKIHCCMDNSDGLSSSLHQLAKQNDVGFVIDQQSLPVSPMLSVLQQKGSTIDITNSILHFGGDYELICTLSAEDFQMIRTKLRSEQIAFTDIGRVTMDKKIILKNQNSKTTLPDEGYQHFIST